jgi:hypothetical protein
MERGETTMRSMKRYWRSPGIEYAAFESAVRAFLFFPFLLGKRNTL